MVTHQSDYLAVPSYHLQVHYTFNKILMLQEPLLVVGAFYILFFTVIIYVRLDFAITKVEKTESHHELCLRHFFVRFVHFTVLKI